MLIEKEKAWLTEAKKIMEMEACSISECANELGSQFVRCVGIILETKGIVYTSGVGGSGVVALRFAHLLSCSGVRSIFLHPTEGVHGNSGVLKPEDILILISKGGMTDELEKFARVAKDLNVPVMAFSENEKSSLFGIADYTLKLKSKQEEGLLKFVAPVSSVVHSSICDAICAIVILEGRITRKKLKNIHPGGEVGKELNRRLLQ